MGELDEDGGHGGYGGETPSGVREALAIVLKEHKRYVESGGASETQPDLRGVDLS